MVSVRALISLLFLMVSAICLSQFAPSGKTIRYRTIASGTQSNQTRQFLRLINDRADLENFWKPVLQQNSALPTVDFFKDRLVIVFLGQKGTGGYSASVRGVTSPGGSTANLSINEITPAPGQSTVQMITSPWVMIAVDRAYLDFTLTVQAVQGAPFQSGGGFIPYWQPCWVDTCYGYGGNWDAPGGYIFYSDSQYSRWNLDFGLTISQTTRQVNFNAYAFGVITLGNLGVDYRAEVRDVIVRNGVANVIVRRDRASVRGSGRPWLGIQLDRTVRSINVQVIDGPGIGLIEQGLYLTRQEGAVVISNSDSFYKAVGNSGSTVQTKLGQKLEQFDFEKEDVGIVNFKIQDPTIQVQFEGIRYQGNIAVVQYSRLAGRGLNNTNVPYLAVRVKKGTKQIRTEEIRVPVAVPIK